MSYYGIFEHFNILDIEGMRRLDIYEDYFADIYEYISSCGHNELEIYTSNAFQTGGNILELGCGNGRITLELAKKGFKVIGIDNSSSMLRILEDKLSHLNAKTRKNVVSYNQDVFNMKIDDEYNLAIIPATTVCLFLEDIDRFVALANQIYDRLPKGGRFVFDYRIDQRPDEKRETSVRFISRPNQEGKEFALFQEFDNYIPGVSVGNMYAERIINGETFRYLGYTKRKIVTEEMINNIVSQTKFNVINKINFKLVFDIETQYIVLEK
ncbi:MAG TPA: class I SAM-dependent methyltransferase [Pseudobacteroides sp.]|nr:class I SAM-dependent methyltransferase [Pseudobacteroides sp.]